MRYITSAIRKLTKECLQDMVWHFWTQHSAMSQKWCKQYTSNYVQGNYSARNHIYEPM